MRQTPKTRQRIGTLGVGLVLKRDVTHVWVSVKVFHHEPRQHEGHASATTTFQVFASGSATERLSDDMTSDAKFAAIQATATAFGGASYGRCPIVCGD